MDSRADRRLEPESRYAPGSQMGGTAHAVPPITFVRHSVQAADPLRALARILVLPLTPLDRAFLAALVDAALARHLGVDDQRAIDFHAVVVGEHGVERLELAEHAHLQLRQIDFGMARKSAARVDGLLDSRPRRQLDADERLRIWQRIADVDVEIRAHGLP